MCEIKKELAAFGIEIIQSSGREIVKALEELKATDEPHTEFYESLQARQREVVNDLEAMMQHAEAKKTAES